MNILSIIEDPAFSQQADAAIHQFCKEVTEITYIEHGIDNVVALVNSEYVFRFPRHPNAAKRLYFETALLQKVGRQLTAAKVPELVQVHTQPFYSVSKFIEGGHLTGQQIQQLSPDEQIATGRTIAEFIVQLNKAISGLEIRRLRHEAVIENLEEPWDVYFKRIFEIERLPNEKLRPIVNEYYSLWKDYVAKEQKTYAIHDDLHPANLLFLGGRLNGIVDFGDTNTGSIEEEMRWMYLMGETVLKSTMEHYRLLTGVNIDHDHIRVWAIMHELSSYTSRLARQQTETTPFKRAQDHLRSWLPNFPL